jgi:hypothetical protein
MHMADQFEGFEVVDSYTTKEAVADGVRVDLSTVGRIPIYAPVCRGIRYATRALLAKGYMSDDKPNLPNLADLLVQVSLAIRKRLAKGEDRLFECRVEFPGGQQGKIWAAINEEGSLTLMLPTDY